MGDHAMYLRLLTRFRDEYQSGTTKIVEALDASDLTRAQLLTHTLKGATGMIGARAAYTQASALERAMRAGLLEHGPAIEHLNLALTELALEVEAVLTAPQSSGAPVRNIARAAPAAALEQLTRLLRSGNSAAVDIMEEQGDALAEVLGAARFKLVAQAMYGYDFDAALATIASAQ